MSLIFFLKYNFKSLLRPVRFLVYFLPITFFIHFFFTEKGYDLFLDTSTLNIMELFDTPLRFTLRIWNIILLTGFGLKYMRGGELLDGMTLFLSAPARKFRFVDDLNQILYIALRFFPIVREEYAQVSLVEKMFHIEKADTLRKKIERLKWIIPSVFAISLKRAENLAIAMHLRGYGLYFPRTNYITDVLKLKDWLIILICLIIIVLILSGRFWV